MNFKQLEVDFFTQNSVLYNICFEDKINIGFKNITGYCGEVHVHFNKYNLVRITIIISNENEACKPKFVESLIIQLDDKLTSVFGFLDRDLQIEANLVVFYNQFKITYGPFLLTEEEIQAAASFVKEGLKYKLDEI